MFAVKPNIVALLTEKLNENFGENILSSKMMLDMPTIEVKKDCILEVLNLLFHNNDLEFKFLTSLCGVHYPEQENALGVVYHLHSFKHNFRIRIKCFTSLENPVFPSATGIFSAANWMERETYDFFGILFDGHPNLKRILNVDDMTDFPLRKEFPLEDQTRDDKDDKFFGR